MIRRVLSAGFPSGVWAGVLIASVLLNGIVLGVLGAGLAAGIWPSRDAAPAAAPPSFRLFARMSPDIDSEMWRRMREEAGDARPLIRAAREADDAVMRALAAEPFDAAAARAAFARADAARDALQARAHEMTIMLFSDLPPEARETMIQRAARPGRGRDGARRDREERARPAIPGAAPPAAQND